jgi:hypothetical protein
VHADRVILLNAHSIAEAYPGRWWLPPADAFAAVEEGGAHVKVLAVESDPDGGADLWQARAVWLEVEQCDAAALTGTIVETELDRAGYEEGDRLTVALDRVFDIAFVDDDGEFIFNRARAEFAIGKRVLVGITVLSHDEQDVVERHSFAGTVALVDPDRGIELRLDDGSSYWLPPDTDALREAPPGEYRLHATGQTVVDPDYVATWTITQAAPGQSDLSPDGFTPPGGE